MTPIADTETPTGQAPRLVIIAAPRVNAALQQNAVPVIRDIEIVNDADAPLCDLQLTITSEPGFLHSRTWPIDRIGARSRFHIRDLKVDLDTGFLLHLREAVRGRLILTLSQDGRERAVAREDVELLANDEWGGVTDLPEIIAAFVQPNDPSVQTLLRSASAVLRSAGQQDSLEGYQSGSPRRVATMVSAVWTAICDLGLTYAVPPASFETEGQKVRPPSRVVETRLATCLDTTLLFASCLEQAGLKPVVVFLKDHAFVGVWLQDEAFTSAVIDDAQTVRKRVDLRELLVIESTLVANKPVPPFTLATEEAKRRLAADEDFCLAIDISRARAARIRPLSDSGAIASQSGAAASEANGERPPIPLVVPDLPDEVTGIEGSTREPAPLTADARVEHWMRKLLDLSLRNRLLNFKVSKRAAIISCPNPALLEDRLAEGDRFRLLSISQLDGIGSDRSADLHRRQHLEDLEKERLEQALLGGDLYLKADEQQTAASLLELYRTARSAIQEGGANILYLALGFLEWRQKGKNDRAYRAPLVLVPVELKRKSVQSGFQLLLHEDEPRFNPTLLEMLKQDFALELPYVNGELPTDDSGLDIKGIWDYVRREIRDIEGWEVVEDVVLSTFSFSKYLMWKDLQERLPILKESPVVSHLIDSPREPYGGNEGSFKDPTTLDVEIPPSRTYTPLVADSSQISSVFAAAEGHDFVLIGPPGTGKSQTIANMIAQCLAEGKTVLFVAEKTAALEVVYRRLQSVGLGDFCLELHSNKARKAEVIQQLGRAWEANRSDANDWEREASRLETLRNGLNEYVAHLHRNWPNGLSVYRAIGRILKSEDVPCVSLEWPSPEYHDRDLFESLEDIAKRIDIHRGELDGIAEHPLAAVESGDWSPGWQMQLVHEAQSLRMRAEALEATLASFAVTTGLPITTHEERQLHAVAALAQALHSAYGQPYGFVFGPVPPTTRSAMREAVVSLNGYAAAWHELSAPYERMATTLPLNELRLRWEHAESRWFLPKWWVRRDVKKVLRNVTEGKVHAENPAADLSGLLVAAEHERDVNRHNHLGVILGAKWQGLDTDVRWLTGACDWGDNILGAVGQLCDQPAQLSEWKRALGAMIGDANDMLWPGGQVHASGQGFLKAYDSFNTALQTTMALAGVASAEKLHDKRELPFLKSIGDTCKDWIEAERKLNHWCAWRRVRDEAVANGLGPLIESVETGTLAQWSAADLFSVSYCRWWVSAVIDRDDVLRTFVPAEHTQRIQDFARLDKQFMELTSRYVQARLAGNIPSKSAVPRNSEWSVLSRELQKKKRHLPLRQLMSKMRDALTTLTPCLMMSPMSIAQYLPPDSKAFDVVIFDEASQIPVWDAIGAIARGNQAVIVGDPKQLPPTSFFNRRENDDIDSDVEVEDLESILDECIGANIPTKSLRWHYRSQSESLITFSNHRYYGGGLVTFPSPMTPDIAVTYHHVEDAIYEKGGARVNQGEARAIVHDIVQRLLDPGFRQSIGVVTFNTEQQALIEDLLEEERRAHPEIEAHFSDSAIEAVFVKNLESVQGDERDIIYFSVTYGPDRSGKVSMNFGPLNQQGGPRRLNVAVTRARQQMRVFAGLLPEQIDLSRTQAEGVRDLKHFLDFAVRGPRALGEAVEAPLNDFDSYFEEVVAARLVRLGWSVHAQIGVSGFRIDLGVVHPNAPGNYLAGIECDGATYHRSATARDRDYLRERVLRGLGWEIIRIWSTDWWTDPEAAAERVDQELRQLLGQTSVPAVK